MGGREPPVLLTVRDNGVAILKFNCPRRYNAWNDAMMEGLTSALAAAAENAMVGFRRDNPRGKHGEHRVALSDWGLAADEIREHFRAYIDLFQIPAEG